VPEAAPRLLLVELLSDDPLHQHRTKPYPFIQGWVRRRGGRCRWVSVAAGKEARPKHPYLVEPSKDTNRLIAGAVEAFAPTHVLVNERIGRALVRAVNAASGGARLLRPPNNLLEDPSAAQLDRLLGFKDPVRTRNQGWRKLFVEATPDYEHERLDPEVPTADHFVPILVEPRCVYRRSAARNPVFSEVDLRDVEFGHGCTFCCFKPGSTAPPSPSEAVERALLQVRRYPETVPEGLRRDRFLFHLAPAFPKLTDFLAGLVDLELPPSRLFFTCRVDELLSAAGALRAHMPAMAERGHTVNFWQIGLESFSPDENERFNKGVGASQIEAAVALTDELEAAWPGSFVFREHGGFTMILFTPWTRLEDLRVNAEEIQRHGLTEQYAMLTTSLQLRAGTPLEALARRDGLTVDTDDPKSDPFDTACITHWGEDELPWRFRHPEVAAVFRAMSHLFPTRANVPVDLPGGEHAGTDLPPRPPVFDHAAVLEALVEIARGDPGADTRSLLAALPDKLEELGKLERKPEDDVPVPREATLPGWLVRLMEIIGEDDGRPWSAPAGAELETLRPAPYGDGGHRLDVLLEVGGEHLELRLTPRRPGARAYRVAGPVAISHARETPLDSPEKAAAVDALAHLLERAGEALGED